MWIEWVRKNNYNQIEIDNRMNWTQGIKLIGKYIDDSCDNNLLDK